MVLSCGRLEGNAELMRILIGIEDRIPSDGQNYGRASLRALMARCQKRRDEERSNARMGGCKRRNPSYLFSGSTCFIQVLFTAYIHAGTVPPVGWPRCALVHSFLELLHRQQKTRHNKLPPGFEPEEHVHSSPQSGLLIASVNAENIRLRLTLTRIPLPAFVSTEWCRYEGKTSSVPSSTRTTT